MSRFEHEYEIRAVEKIRNLIIYWVQRGQVLVHKNFHTLTKDGHAKIEKQLLTIAFKLQKCILLLNFQLGSIFLPVSRCIFELSKGYIYANSPRNFFVYRL